MKDFEGWWKAIWVFAAVCAFGAIGFLVLAGFYTTPTAANVLIKYGLLAQVNGRS